MDYQNNFEKELFYAINLLRTDPSSFARQVQAACYRGLIPKKPNVEALMKQLEKSQPVHTLKYDDLANAAVRQNNEAIYSAAQDSPAPGGNLA